MDIVTADLYDAHHETVGVCALQFRSFGKRRSFFGPCATVATFEDHTPVLNVLSEPGNGRVLVVDGQGSLRIGLMGDRLAEIGVRNGWAGVVINGAIRDSLGIDALAIGVKALGATARRGWTPGTVASATCRLASAASPSRPATGSMPTSTACSSARTELDLLPPNRAPLVPEDIEK